MPLINEFFGFENIIQDKEIDSKGQSSPETNKQLVCPLVGVGNQSSRNAFLCFIPAHGFRAFFGVQPRDPSVSEDLFSDTSASFRFAVKLNVSHFPCFTPDNLTLNARGNLAVLSGNGGILIVNLPKDLCTRCSEDDLKSEYLCRSECLDERLFSQNSSINCVKVGWHPCSLSMEVNYLVALFSDSTLRFYDVNQPCHPVMKISLWNCESPTDMKRDVGSEKSKMGMTESFVGFDFGDPQKSPQNEEEICWPIYALQETGEVSSLLVDMKTLRHFGVQGPLTMYPPAEVDYGIDSCDILYLSGPGPVLVIATKYGILYNCVLLKDEDSAAEDLDPLKKECLYVYESLELELTLAVSDLQTGEQTEDTASCMIRLSRDSQADTRFYCIHDSGVHSVNLGWLHDLARIGAERSKEATGSTDLAASVDYVVCTKPRGSECPPGLLNGFLALSDPPKSGTFALVFLANWTVVAAPLRWLKEVKFVSRNGDMNSSDMETSFVQKKDQDSLYFIDEIKRILHRNSTVPLLKSQKKQLSEKDAGELLLRHIEILNVEYLQKLENARDFCDGRVGTLISQKNSELSELNKTRRRLESTDNALETAEKRCEDQRLKQADFTRRIGRLNSVLHRISGTSSNAEDLLIDKLLRVQGATDALTERIENVKELISDTKIGNKENYEPRSSTAQHGSLRRILEEQNDELEALISSARNIDAQLSSRSI